MEKKVLLGGIAILALIVIVGFLATSKRPPPHIDTGPAQAISVRGTITAFDPATQLLTLASSTRDVVIAITASTTIHTIAGDRVGTSSLQDTEDASIIGTLQNSSLLNATSIIVGNKRQEDLPVHPDNIFDGSIVPNAYSITGLVKRDWFAKGYFIVKVIDGNGALLSQSNAYQQHYNGTSTEFLPFSTWLSFDSPTTATGTIIFQKPLFDASSTNSQSISISFAFQAGKTAVKLYYPNIKRAEYIGDACSSDSILPIVHYIPDSNTPITDTIKNLLLGNLSPEEKMFGFTTEFPIEGLSLTGTDYSNGTLTLIFNEAGLKSLDACHMGLLKAEIEKTAQQYSVIKNVLLKPDSVFGS